MSKRTKPVEATRVVTLPDDRGSSYPRFLAECPLGGFYVVTFQDAATVYLDRPSRYDEDAARALESFGLTFESNPASTFRGAQYLASGHLTRNASGEWAYMVEGHRTYFKFGTPFALRSAEPSFARMLADIEAERPGLLHSAQTARLAEDRARAHRALSESCARLNEALTECESKGRALADHTGAGEDHYPRHLARVEVRENGSPMVSVDGATVGVEHCSYGARLRVEFSGDRDSLDGANVNGASIMASDDLRAALFGLATPDASRPALLALARAALDALADRSKSAELLRLASAVDVRAELSPLAEVETYRGLDDVVRAARAWIVALDDMAGEFSPEHANAVQSERLRLERALSRSTALDWATPRTVALHFTCARALDFAPLKVERRASRGAEAREASLLLALEVREALLVALEPYADDVES